MAEKKMPKGYSVKCPYCGQKAKLIDSKELFGHSYGYVYICEDCDARVGCKKGTCKPQGTMADAKTRVLRQKAYNAFASFWPKAGFINKDHAMTWLCKRIGVAFAEATFNRFDYEQCKAVLKVIAEEVKQ